MSGTSTNAGAIVSANDSSIVVIDPTLPPAVTCDQINVADTFGTATFTTNVSCDATDASVYQIDC